MKQWRKVKQALNEAKMNVRDTRKLEKEFENASGISIWWTGLQSEGCGTRGERSCRKRQEQVLEPRNLGHDGSETVGILGPTGPRLGDEHETSCERDQKNRADIFLSTEAVMVFSSNLETIVRQRQYSQNPVVVLVIGSRLSISRSKLSVLSSSKDMQQVTIVVRDQKKPDELEERGRSTLVTAIQMVRGKIVCKVTEADVANVAVDDSTEINVWTSAFRKFCEVFVKNDHVTKRGCLGPCELWEKCQTQMLDHWTTNAMPSNSFKSLFA